MSWYSGCNRVNQEKQDCFIVIEKYSPAIVAALLLRGQELV